MYGRKTLKLRRAPDPKKIELSERIGRRFIDRGGRYIMQERVRYEDKNELSWVDIPLVPETYGGTP